MATSTGVDALLLLVPVGPQVDAEAWHGLRSLDLWLRSVRSRP